MTTLQEFVSMTLADRKVDEPEVAQIRQRLVEDGRLDLADVKLLVELYCSAQQRCTAFEDLFFEVLEQVLLEDGEIQPAEQFYLLKMLYSDREVQDREKEFLRTLCTKATRTTPEFEALCEEAFRAHPTQWSVGGN